MQKLLFTLLMLTFGASLSMAQSTPSQEDQVFETVDESAEPIGGMAAFYAWIGQNLKYPAQAKQKKTQGKVIVACVVDKDGSIKDVEAIRGPKDGLDEEAVRVVSTLPAWKPAKHQGRIVKQRMIIPIAFTLR